MRKISSLILTILFMTILLMPITGQAATYRASIGQKKYTSIQKAIDAVKDGETITLLRNTSTTKSVTIDKKDLSFTIDLNEKSYSYTGDDTAFLIKAGSITFKNGTVSVSGRIMEVKASAKAVIASGSYNGYFLNRGNLSILDGTFTTKDCVTLSIKELIRNYKTLTIKGGSFTGSKDNLIENRKGAKASLLGGSFKCTSSSYPSILNQSGATMTLKGLSVQGKNTAVTNFGHMTIKGGSYQSSKKQALKNTGDINITAGTFTLSDTNSSEAILNLGQMIITKASVKEGGIVNTAYYDDKTYEAILDISGGTFTTSKNLVIDNFYGNLKISGGKFTTTDNSCVSASHSCEISGGTFLTKKSAPKTNTYSTVVIYASPGFTTTANISDGSFENKGYAYALEVCDGASTSLSGGSFKTSYQEKPIHCIGANLTASTKALKKLIQFDE